MTSPVWYRRAGSSTGVPIVYVHGGPGFNSYCFERSAGALLEQEFPVVYFDQRSCGRSPASSGKLDMETLCEDLEWLRGEVGVGQVDLIGHSFGGLVALEYRKRFPKSVRKLALVDVTPDVPAMMEHQIGRFAGLLEATDLEGAARVRALLTPDGTPLSHRRKRAAGLVQPRPAFRDLLYASDETQMAHERVRAESGLKTNAAYSRDFGRSGYLDECHEELFAPLGASGILVTGKHSQCVGLENLKAAAGRWNIPLVELPGSGHFPFFEQPEEFARTVADFMAGRSHSR